MTMRSVAAATTSVPVVDAAATIQEASAAMLEERVEAAILVDGASVDGLVTAREVAASLADRDVGSTRVADIARRDLLIVRQREPLADVRERMRAADVPLAVVIDEAGRPVGVLPDDGAAIV